MITTLCNIIVVVCILYDFRSNTEMLRASFIFWLLLTIHYSSLPTDAETVYVRPQGNGSRSDCPAQPCLTLNDYAREVNQLQYFQENTIFKFLPGIHHLDIHVQLEHISNIAFIALSDHSSVNTYVFLGSFSVNISWTECYNVKVSGLSFIGGHLEVRFLFSVLIFHRTVNVSLSQVTLFGIQSTAIEAHSSQVNFSDLTVSGATGHSGAALVAWNSTLDFHGRNVFSNNVGAKGGAMAFYKSVAVFRGNNLFLNNTATVSAHEASLSSRPRGGAIFCNNSIASFQGYAVFKQNRATSPTQRFAGEGGAVAAVSGSSVLFHMSANVLFAYNSAKFVGGALSINASNLFLQGQVLFEENSAISAGGAVIGSHNSSIFCTGKYIKFLKNSANNFGFGGAIYSFSSKIQLKEIHFEGNAAKNGGAIYYAGGPYLYTSKCVFVNNTAISFAGAAYIQYSTTTAFDGGYFKWNSAFKVGAIATVHTNITFRGVNVFLYNNATKGSGCLSISSSNAFLDGNSTFQGNHGSHGGAMHGIFSHVSIQGTSSFMGNSAMGSVGGGIRMSNSTVIVIGQAIFDKNVAKTSGSALSVLSCTVAISGNITISHGVLSSHISINNIIGSAIYFLSSKIIFSGTLTIANNSATGIGIRDSEVSIGGCIAFLNNQRLHRYRGGAVFARGSKVTLRGQRNCSSRFQYNVATVGGAIFAIDSSVELSGSQYFVQNAAERGGALALSGGSKLVLKEPFTINFAQNYAVYSGGAVYYEDTFSISQCARLHNLTSAGPDDCFIAINSTSKQHTRLTFSNNAAGSAGAVLYGGSLESCKLYIGGGIVDNCGNIIGGVYSNSPIRTILEISNIISDKNKTSDISSDPFQICFCVGGSVECNNQKIETVRGKEFTFMAVIVGQNKGIVPSAVRTSLDNGINIAISQRVQNTGKECTPITYRLSTIKNSTILLLFPDGPCRDIEFSRREIHVSFLPCPDAFILDGSECVCEERLQKYINSNSCSVDTNTIQRSSNTFWMGTVHDDNQTYEGLILHAGCPFDYCVDTPVLIELSNLDIQCDHNHSGTLCGSCINNYSIALGTLHCLPCSSVYLTLLVPFACAGIVLVTLILLLQLSVAFGTINGLIFYANVIQANHSIFFPPGKTNFLTVFISWLNLDLGFETCFYDGMTTYVYTWLQFSFPFYLWFLIGLMIVMSRHSRMVARAIGKNPVAALATLFLLSYSKLLLTIIVALSFTSLEYPDGTHKLVWLYDANIPYFQTIEHIILGGFALLVLFVLFLPYTLLLLCGHWLQAYSNWWIFSWLNKIKPFMDAYHAPYKKQTRYWTGCILLLRCVLFLVFTFNALGNGSINLLAITSATASLAVLAWLHKRIYELLFNDILEASFILNLCIFSAATYHVKETGLSQAGLAYTSVGIAFASFIFILFYHVYIRLHETETWKKLPKPSTIKRYALNKLTRLCCNDNAQCDARLPKERENVKLPTVTVIELSDPSLEM